MGGRGAVGGLGAFCAEISYSGFNANPFPESSITGGYRSEQGH